MNETLKTDLRVKSIVCLKKPNSEWVEAKRHIKSPKMPKFRYKVVFVLAGVEASVVCVGKLSRGENWEHYDLYADGDSLEDRPVKTLKFSCNDPQFYETILEEVLKMFRYPPEPLFSKRKTPAEIEFTKEAMFEVVYWKRKDKKYRKYHLWQW